MKPYFVLLYSVFQFVNISTLSAQVEQVVYQSFYVSDSTMQIEFDVADAHEVIPWHHESKVMVEVTIRLDGITMTTLGLLIKEGRYNVALDNLYPITTMRNVDSHRSLVKNARGELCFETVFMRIYVPEGFVVKKNTEPKIPLEQPSVAKSEKRQ